MSTNFHTTFTVPQTPQQVFDAICDVRSWWAGEIEGSTDTLGAEFDYTVPGVHFSRQRIIELDPGHLVRWVIVDSRLDYLEDKQEWNGTTVTFDLAETAGGTQISFTHVGLVPDVECYDACSAAWSSIIGDALRQRVTEGAASAHS